MATAEAEADTERLTGPQIVALAKAISVDKMTTIALNYLRLSKAKVRNITADFPGDAETQSREMLWTWANKNPDNQVTVRTNKSFIESHQLIHVEGLVLQTKKKTRPLLVSRCDKMCTELNDYDLVISCEIYDWHWSCVNFFRE